MGASPSQPFSLGQAAGPAPLGSPAGSLPCPQGQFFASCLGWESAAGSWPCELGHHLHFPLHSPFPSALAACLSIASQARDAPFSSQSGLLPFRGVLRLLPGPSSGSLGVLLGRLWGQGSSRLPSLTGALQGSWQSGIAGLRSGLFGVG